MVNVYEAVSANKNKSMLVMLLFVVFVTAAIYFISLGMGYYFGYEPGGLGIAGLAFIVSGLMSLGSYYFSDKIVLSISGARPADRKRDFNFYTVAENLSFASGLPQPKLYIIDDTAPNAFATGRDPDHAVIVATTGLLDKLTRTELEGVIAHELSHVKNYDTRLMSIVAVLIGTVALLGDWFLRMTWHSDNDNDSKKGGIFIVVGLVFALLSPFIGQLIQLAISRRREYLADASSVSLTRQPSGLISALQKISADQEPLEAANKATAHMYIVSPFKGHEKRAVSWFSGLFNTHPPMQDRITALKNMG